ncbi:ABC transporter ATP-binding protein [Bacillus sp. FJAT-47783]|uniref:ABC transporter ATP-binding protein n=1 Tax=Bacillus sp. FJAT-47783 TaxID=2922712 RepID=UPI001FAC6B4A|nr:ABC transporter ATP-binding protein [Bacillus sp. FJAT-47783]
MRKSYIHLEKVTKQIHHKLIFKDIDLTVNKGELIAVVGPSGTGKSTLLRCIAGLDPLSSGVIRIEGEDVTNVPAHKRPVTMMFQEPLLFGHMTVLENVIYGLTFSKIKKREREQKGLEFLSLVQLREYASRYPHEMSGGQQQRVALARAIITNPKLLLLDEPFSHLDNELRTKVRQWVRSLLKEQKMTAIFVTHDIEEAMVMGDRMAIFADQQLLQVGTPMEIYEKPNDAKVATFYCDGFLLNEHQFVFTHRLKRVDDNQKVFMKWKATVENQFKKHGQTFYRLNIPNAEAQIVMRMDDFLEIGETVLIGLETEEDVYHFPRGEQS